MISELGQYLQSIYTPEELKQAEEELDNLPLEGIEAFLEICEMVEAHEQNQAACNTELLGHSAANTTNEYLGSFE